MASNTTESALTATISGTELLASVADLTNEWCAVREMFDDSTYKHLVRARLVPLQRELARRIDGHAAGRGPDPRAGWIVDLAGVAQELQRVADVRYPLDLYGWSPARRSSSGELAGPCPWCGGRDRFVVWPSSSDRYGRAWCRRCQWTGDIIQLYRDLEGVSFVRAVEDLAGRFGVALPRISPDDALVVLGNGRRVLEAAS